MDASTDSFDSFGEVLVRAVVSAVVFPLITAVIGPIPAVIVTTLLNGGNGDGGTGGACA